MTEHNNEQARQDMLGHKHIFSDFSVKDWLTIATLIFVGGGAYVGMSTKVENLQSQLGSVPAAIDELKKTIETNRTERNEEMRDLNRRVTVGEAERARIDAQVDGLKELMTDIRNLMRKDAQQYEEKPQQ
jgi:prefoldin subunit 5